MTLLLKSKNALEMIDMLYTRPKKKKTIIIIHGNPQPACFGVTKPIFLELKTFMFHGFGVQKG